MKVCVFSDIHGNKHAFRVAYNMIIDECADLNIFLGDLCGYYFDQYDILDMLQTIPNLIAIKGNHDAIFLKIVNGDEGLRKDYLIKYGSSMENLLKGNNCDLIQWLNSLPESYISSDLDLSCYHGSPWDTMECYVYPDSSLDKFLDYQCSLFVLGHTHYRMYRKTGEKIIINPGSLGQPRDGGWPTYTVMDYTLKKNIIREVPYDKSELLKKIDAIGDDNPYLKRFLGK